MTGTEDERRPTLSTDVLFDFDEWAIRPDARPALAQVAAVLRGHPGRPVTVQGHTDCKGSDAYNQRLSERRAGAVRVRLADAERVRGHTWLVRGHGESRPVVPNETPDGRDDPAGRQKNRRVEIVIAK